MNLSPPQLLHERCRPDFRDVFGTLAEGATEIDTAINRIRFSGINLRPIELAKVRRFRVLVGEMNAHALGAEAEAVQTDPKRAESLDFLVHAIDRGMIEIRSAPLAGWHPDFSIFFRDGTASDLLAGLHWFERPYPFRGPVLGFHLRGEPARCAALRFDEMWRYGHDIRAAIQHILTTSRRRSVDRTSGFESSGNRGLPRGPFPARRSAPVRRVAEPSPPLTPEEKSD